jgi:hypothetical protein
MTIKIVPMTNIKLIFVLALGIIIGISFTNLFKGCGSGSVPDLTVNNVKPAAIEKEAVKAEEKYQLQIDSLNATSIALNKQLKVTTQTLTTVKKKSLVLQTQVYDLIDRGQGNTDSLQLINDCDSLKTKVVELIESGNEKDSLYEDANANLDKQLKNKDSTIQVKDTEYQSLKISFKESLSQQQILYDQNKGYQKQFKRQKVKSKLLSAAVLILSGVAANYFIHH